jgi:hypothetical protein
MPRPLELAESILGYRLLPVALVAPSALILPFAEFWAAAAVLAGPARYRRAGALILGLLSVVFLAAAAQGLIRGLDFECGCFGADDGRRPGALFFLQDAALVLAAAVILRLDGDRPPAKPSG